MKSVHTVRTASQIPSAIAAAWESALTAPHGPVWVEIPQDVLLAETTAAGRHRRWTRPRTSCAPRPELTAVAADLLSSAARPAIIAGGGVVRADASRQAAGARREAGRAGRHDLRRQGRVPLGAPAVAPVLAGGPAHHGLPGGRRRPAGRRLGARRTLLELPHVRPARPGRPDRGGPRQAGVQPPGLGIHADARLALAALLETVEGAPRRPRTRGSGGPERVRARSCWRRSRERIAGQELDPGAGGAGRRSARRCRTTPRASGT